MLIPSLVKHIAPNEELEAKIAERCVALAEEPEQIKKSNRIPLVSEANCSKLIAGKISH
jgi:hypothetical protein